jgi:hypothetical protein
MGKRRGIPVMEKREGRYLCRMPKKEGKRDKQEIEEDRKSVTQYF